MVRRVVLGSGSLAQTVAESLLDRPGSLHVVATDEGRASTLRDEGIDVALGDPTDPQTLAELDAAGVVVVADDDYETNLAATRIVRTSFPDAHVVAYTGTEYVSDPADLEAVADQVVDPGRATTDFLMERVGDAGLHLRQLHRVLRGIDRLAVVTHDNPDPDAIASAVALGRIAEAVGCDVDVCYFGDITHQENRAFVNLLQFDLTNLEQGDVLDTYDGVALVDHSRPGVNDGLPEGLQVDVVIDHHPPRAPVEARFVDLRSEVGATSTLLVDYLEYFGLDLTEDVATGLLFGIRVDTKEFTREVSPADFEAAGVLLPHADLGMLERIEAPSISADTLETIATAIGNRRQEGQVLLSCVGRLSQRDALAQAADRLLTLDGVTTTLVYGVLDGTIYASARSRGSGVDLGETLRDAFGQIGSAGGHADMAGAQITLGVLDEVEDRDESLMEIVEAVVSERFLEELEARSEQAVTGVYGPEFGSADEYLVPEEDLPVTQDEPDETG
ncbi:DHH family phosphoesterase [Halobacteriales archaeon Cl-PHB]